MSASQFARNLRAPHGAAPSPSLDGDAASIEVAECPVGVDLERVLAEINHELGNYFHKLYYWADTVAVPDAHDGLAPEMLGRTLQGLESFLRSAFGHFQPVELELTRMSAAGVAAAIAQHVQPGDDRGESVEVAVELHDGERPLALDPGRLSQLVDVMVQRVRARRADDSRLRLTADDRTEGGVAFRLAVTPAATAHAFGAAAVLAWAKARQLAELHGGRLWEIDAAEDYAVTLFLPA